MMCETCKENQIKYNFSCFDINDSSINSFYFTDNNALIIVTSCQEKFGLYIKENSNECIPLPDKNEGYYVSNTQTGLLSKCHDNCLSCSNGPIKDDSGNIQSMECIKCKDENNLEKTMIKFQNNCFKILHYNETNIIFYISENKPTLIGNCKTFGKAIYYGEYECIDKPDNTYYVLDDENDNTGVIQDCNINCYKSIYKTFGINTTLTEFKKQIRDNIILFINSSRVINGSNFLAVISSSDDMNPEEQLKNGISSVDIGNCNNDLKNYYNISNEENLIILNMESKNDESLKEENNNDKSFILGKNTQLEIYDYSGRKLNLSVCKEDIKVLKYIGDVKQLDLYLANNFANKGIDVFNASDDFFNNICHPFDNPYNKDITINDRRNDIYQNATFCQDGCSYKGINYDLKAVNCICNSNSFQEEKNTEEHINLDKEVINFKNLGKAFIANLFDFNFEFLRCTNLVFNKEIINNNIGLYCLSSMFALQIIFVFTILIKKLTSLKNFMLKFGNRNLKNNQNRKKINIINNRNIKKINNNKYQKNKLISTPPIKQKNILNKKIYINNKKQNIDINHKLYKYNLNKMNQIPKNIDLGNTLKNESYNILKSQSLFKPKINSTKSLLISKNNIKGINNQIPNICNKRNFIKRNNLSKDKNGIKFNKVKEIKLIHINNNIYNIKSNKRPFFKKDLSNVNGKYQAKNNNNKIFQSIIDIQDMEYKEAIIYDKRNCLKIYWGFLVDSQIILGTFCTDNYLDLFAIKLSFLVFTFQISFFLNALFYTDEYISNAYHNDGILDFFSGLPKSIYSFVATLITTNLLRLLSSSKSELIKLIREKRNYPNYFHLIKMKLSKLCIKLIIYFILVFIFSLLFLYYVTAFCAVYKNSQKYWFYGCLESFGTDCLVALNVCIFVSLFRYISIKKKIKCCYIFANIIANFI